MARLGDPADVRLLVSFLRSIWKWSQEQLAKASGVDRGLISDYELGLKVPRRGTLERLGAAVGLPYSWVETLLPIFREARLTAERRLGSRVAAPTEAKVQEKIEDGVEAALVEAVLPRLTPFLMELQTLGPEPLPADEERARAKELCELLLEMPFRRWRVTIEKEPKYWTWAVAEWLCAESERAAAHRADQAVALSQLALRVAELVTCSESSRLHLEGYILGFVANALRVEGDLPRADEEFLRSDRLWIAKRPADPEWLDGSRLLDLKASLRRQQGRQAESCALLDQALVVSSSTEGRARILVKKATSSTRCGHYDEALALLHEAEPLIEGAQDPRLPWLVSFSLAANFGHLGKHKEAEVLLPKLRQLAAESKNELDTKRLIWLEGRIAAGLGRRDQARAALEEVKRYFTAEQIAFDTALASLELAVLYLEEGRTGEVKTLAEEMFWIFDSQGVAEEALAAIRLFCEAAKTEEATLDLARRMVEYLQKAQYQPELRFEAELMG